MSAANLTPAQRNTLKSIAMLRTELAKIKVAVQTAKAHQQTADANMEKALNHIIQASTAESNAFNATLNRAITQRRAGLAMAEAEARKNGRLPLEKSPNLHEIIASNTTLTSAGIKAAKAVHNGSTNQKVVNAVAAARANGFAADKEYNIAMAAHEKVTKSLEQVIQSFRNSKSKGGKRRTHRKRNHKRKCTRRH